MAATFTDRELYGRGAATLIGSWEAIARGSAGAKVVRVPGAAAAVFPSEPERTIYNNAFLARDLAPPERVAARGYALDTATRAMAMPLDAVEGSAPHLVLAPPDWADYVRHLEAVGVPP